MKRILLMIFVLITCSAMTILLSSCDISDNSPDKPSMGGVSEKPDNDPQDNPETKDDDEPQIPERLDYNLSDDQNSYIVTGIGTFKGTDVIIPQTYNGKPVTAVANGAFDGCKNIKSIFISEGVIEIENNAFNNCDQLTRISIPDSLVRVGENAISKFWNLELSESNDGLYLGNDNNPYLMLIKPTAGEITELAINEKCRFINDGAFSECETLRIVTIGNNIKSISVGAFANCRLLSSVKIENGVESIENSAFTNCTSLRELRIPDSVISIGEGAFKGCSVLNHVILGGGLKRVGYRAFYCCGTESCLFDYEGDINDWVQIEGLDELVVTYDMSAKKNVFFSKQSLTTAVIDRATVINDYAFYDFAWLSDVTIGNTVKTIGDHAFYNCNLLESISIPDSVTSVGVFAFDNCSLRTVHIGSGVTNFKSTPFCGNATLSSITIDKNNKAYTSVDGDLYSKDGKTFVKYAVNKTGNTFIVPNGVTKIGDNAFDSSRWLTSLILPEGVVSIGNNAFGCCQKLVNITVPDSMEEIGCGVFQLCDSLIYNESDGASYLGNENNPYVLLVSVNSYSFLHCSINDNCKVICESAFAGCSRMESIVIPESVKSIGYEAFRSCDMLKSVTIGNGVTYIDGYAFDGCAALTDVTIGSSLTGIGKRVFSGCEMLQTLKFNSSKEDWEAVGKDRYWKTYSAICEVICIDGTVYITDD